jgi:hypothetical protein
MANASSVWPDLVMADPRGPGVRARPPRAQGRETHEVCAQCRSPSLIVVRRLTIARIRRAGHRPLQWMRYIKRFSGFSDIHRLANLNRIGGAAMGGVDYFICLVMSIVMTVGGIQFYFFVQNNHLGKSREYNSPFDDRIPLVPMWVWVYSLLYYPVILISVLTIKSYQMYAYTAFSFLVLLTMQVLIFYVFPVRTPDAWRAYDPAGSASNRMLAWIQRYDSFSNCLPSMHVSTSMLTAIHLHANLGASLGAFAPAVFAFPIVIALSAIFTKQHYVADLPTGAALGWVAYAATSAIVTM